VTTVSGDLKSYKTLFETLKKKVGGATFTDEQIK
jgi:hypothetical protein